MLKEDISEPLGGGLVIGLEEEHLPRVHDLETRGMADVFRQSLTPAFLGSKIDQGILDLVKVRKIFLNKTLIHKIR